MFFKPSLQTILCVGLFTTYFLRVNAVTDCDVLSNLYQSFQAEDKISWPEDSNKCCSVEGVTCENDRITELDLERQEFKGEIDSKISLLSELVTLDLRYNNISGPIPESIASLSKLKYLNLSENNGFTGRIPKTICNLSNLKGLIAYNNLLNGDIPDCIGELSNLEELCLDSNKLSGFIPSSIGDLKNLKNLNLEYNQLSGVIPESLTKLENLEYLKVKGNTSLFGYLPEIENIKDCTYLDTKLCVRAESNVCSNDLRECTEDDFKKVEDFNQENHTSDNDSNNTSGNNNNNSGSKVSVVIIIIVILLIALIIAFVLFKKCKGQGSGKEGYEEEDDVYRSQSKKNILPVASKPEAHHDHPKVEKSFVVLSPKEDDSKPPTLSLDESVFNYVDIKKAKAEEDSRNSSRISTGIKTQEQYENQLQYQNLLNNQNYYLE